MTRERDDTNIETSDSRVGRRFVRTSGRSDGPTGEWEGSVEVGQKGLNPRSEKSDQGVESSKGRRDGKSLSREGRRPRAYRGRTGESGQKHSDKRVLRHSSPTVGSRTVYGPCFTRKCFYK